MHEVSEACCDVFLILCREVEVILHRRCDVRRIWALTPRMHSCWRAAWPYAVVCKRMGYRWAGIWLSGIPSSSLASVDFLLPHFRLTLEFPPDQIRFSQNRRIFFVETPFELHCFSARGFLCMQNLCWYFAPQLFPFPVVLYGTGYSSPVCLCRHGPR